MFSFTITIFLLVGLAWLVEGKENGREQEKNPAHYIKKIVDNLGELEGHLKPMGGISGTIRVLKTVDSQMFGNMVEAYQSTKRNGEDPKSLKAIADLVGGLMDNVGRVAGFLGWAGDMMNSMGVPPIGHVSIGPNPMGTNGDTSTNTGETGDSHWGLGAGDQADQSAEQP